MHDHELLILIFFGWTLYFAYMYFRDRLAWNKVLMFIGFALNASWTGYLILTR
jgi:hypothetical protein